MMVPASAGGGGPDVTNTYGAHKYWRVQGTAGLTVSTAAAYSAMQFKDKAGSLISTSGGTALSSGDSGGNVASNLFDGVDATYWVSTATIPGTPYAGIQFASAQAVMQVGLQKHASMGANPAFTALVEFSNDGLVWYPVGTCNPTNALVSNDSMVWFSLPNTGYNTSRTDFGSHQYWRVVGSENGLINIYAAYSAMAFRDGAGSSITVSGGSTIDNGHTSTFTAAMLFDGTDATFWEGLSSGVVPYCGYEFGSGKTVMQIGLQRHATMDSGDPARLAFFQFSDDGVAWFTAGVAEAFARLSTDGNDVMHWFDLAGAL